MTILDFTNTNFTNTNTILQIQSTYIFYQYYVYIFLILLIFITTNYFLQTKRRIDELDMKTIHLDGTQYCFSYYENLAHLFNETSKNLENCVHNSLIPVNEIESKATFIQINFREIGQYKKYNLKKYLIILEVIKMLREEFSITIQNVNAQISNCFQSNPAEDPNQVSADIIDTIKKCIEFMNVNFNQ